MASLTFTVDSALLRELGERLVGKPHVALGELVKNSYDADATEVLIRLGPDSIEVTDNGHGMTLEEFRKYWMRIGSPHKGEQGSSRNFHRPMTGSKGVGRLAVQFLARRLKLVTVSDRSTRSALVGKVDWDKAVSAGDLTRAKALYRHVDPRRSFPGEKGHGTRITLSHLNQDWSADQIKSLAKEIWWLQPPFRLNPQLTTGEQKAFTVRLESENQDVVQEFESQMKAILDIWHARLVGRLVDVGRGKDDERGERWRARLSLEFSDGTRLKEEYPIPRCKLRFAEFEIRVYHLRYRQPRGIGVVEAREYLNQHGGVHVYDAGFHLPYYGVDTDWLHIEMDHSHRLSASQLLPPYLQVPEGMNFLPTQSRILGVVHVDTARERERAVRESRARASDFLKIQITRDRLETNAAYADLRHLARWAVDFYATHEAKRAFLKREALLDIEPAQAKFVRVEEVLRRYEPEIPAPAFQQISKGVQDAVRASESEAEAKAGQVALLGPLATAGITSLAYQHELRKQFAAAEGIITRLASIQTVDARLENELAALRDDLGGWLKRARATNALFEHLADTENIDTCERLPAKMVIDDVCRQVEFLGRGTVVNTDDVDVSVLLPKASLVEWSALFQNVLINAFNAVADSGTRRVRVSSRSGKKGRAIHIQDTGVGVDLRDWQELFEPFRRRAAISQERRALGYGGTGLGLTIVKLIGENIGCRVGFAQPDEGYRTSFFLSWSER